MSSNPTTAPAAQERPTDRVSSPDKMREERASVQYTDTSRRGNETRPDPEQDRKTDLSCTRDDMQVVTNELQQIRNQLRDILVEKSAKSETNIHVTLDRNSRSSRQNPTR